MPEEIEADKQASGGKETVEASKMATTEMAENAGEHPVKVRITEDCKSSFYPHLI